MPDNGLVVALVLVVSVVLFLVFAGIIFKF